MTNEELIQQARAVVNPRKIAHVCTVGDVVVRSLPTGAEVLLGNDKAVKLRDLLPYLWDEVVKE